MLVEDALMIQSEMEKLLFIISLTLMCIPIYGQENYILENKFRNPVDTSTFHKQPTILLFTHPRYKNCGGCPTFAMQKAFEVDNLGIRVKRKIKLYVIYIWGTLYNHKCIEEFEALKPVNADILFYTDTKFEGTFSERYTPYLRLYDGKGNVYTELGKDYEDVCNKIKELIPLE